MLPTIGISFATALITAFVTALVTTVGTTLTKRWLFEPKLKLALRNDKFGLFKTPWIVQPKISQVKRWNDSDGTNEIETVDQEEVRTEALFVRATVENVSREVALKCRPYLTKVERVRDSVLTIIFLETIPLCWSYFDKSSPQVFDIPRGVNVNLDIASSHQGPGARDFIVPATVVLTEAYRDMFSEVGEYRLTIVVAPENGRPAQREFRIDWTGRWDEVNACALG